MAQPNQFATAIDTFLSDIRGKEDRKSLFFKEVLMQASLSLVHDGTSMDGKHCAEEGLSSFVKELDARYRSEQRTLRVMDTLRPLFDGLLQFTSAFDVLVQAGPAALVVIYGSARLVLQVSIMLDSMHA